MSGGAQELSCGHQARHALDIDFARRRRSVSVLGAVLLLAGVAGALAVAMQYTQALEDLARAERQQARLLRQLRPTTAPGRGAQAQAAAPDAALAAARVQAQLDTPWDAVLRELERLGDPATALLSIDAKGQARTLRLTAEAKSMADVVAYSDRLRASPWVRSAYLSGHETRVSDTVRVIRFVLEVQWQAAS